MAFFKFRQSGDSPSTSNRPTESIEVMRQRAKHRLMGSAVLVLAGVVGFPLLFDTQPRPMPVDVQIDIPDKNKVAPLPTPTTSPTERANVSAASSLDAKEQLVAPDVPKNKVKPPASNVDIAIKNDEASADDVPAPAVVPKTSPKPEPKVERKVEKVEKVEKTDKKADESARAKALLDGKDVPVKSHDDDSRYIIQVGAFAETAKAQEVRMKLERAGLKTYTHVAETPEGPRTRVRLGPFTSKADADKAAAKVKALALPAALLTL